MVGVGNIDIQGQVRFVEDSLESLPNARPDPALGHSRQLLQHNHSSREYHQDRI